MDISILKSCTYGENNTIDFLPYNRFFCHDFFLVAGNS